MPRVRVCVPMAPPVLHVAEHEPHACQLCISQSTRAAQERSEVTVATFDSYLSCAQSLWSLHSRSVVAVGTANSYSVHVSPLPLTA